MILWSLSSPWMAKWSSASWPSTKPVSCCAALTAWCSLANLTRVVIIRVQATNEERLATANQKWWYFCSLLFNFVLIDFCRSISFSLSYTLLAGRIRMRSKTESTKISSLSLFFPIRILSWKRYREKLSIIVHAQNINVLQQQQQKQACMNV